MSEQFREFEHRRQTSSDIQDHLLTLYTWARGWPKDEQGRGPHIFELGVRSGNSTSAFLAAIEVERRGTLWSLDINAPDVPPHWLELPYWDFHQMDALTDRALGTLPPYCQVLFVDIDPHSYAQTLEVCRLWVPRVRFGGVALFHDTDPVAGSPVAQALDEYCRVTPGVEWRNNPGCHGLGVMRIR